MLDESQVRQAVDAFIAKVKPYYIQGEIKEGGSANYSTTKRSKWPEYWPGYNRAVKQRDELRVHIESGVFPDHLIHARSPNQTQAEFDYVKENFKQVTLPNYSDFENTILRALHQSNWTLDMLDQAGDIDEEESFNNYVNRRVEHFGSIADYFKHIIPKIKMLDPMGVLCVMPDHVKTVDGTNEEGEPTLVIDPDSLVDPKVTYFEVDRVVGKQDAVWYLLQTTENSPVMKGNKLVNEGMVLWLVDDVNCWKVYQVGKAHELTFEIVLHFEHNTGFVPVEPLKGRPVMAQGGVIYESFYLPAKDLFDLVLLDSTYLFMIKANSAYPMRVMLGHECDYQDVTSGVACHGGTLLAPGEDGMPVSKGKCPSCKGTGVAARLGPAGVLFVKETPARENGTQTKVQDAMTFVEPTATTLTFLREEINANTTAGRKMLHLYSETPVAGGDAETATQVGVGVKAQTAFIAPIASQIFGLMDFTLSCIARQRYGDDDGMFTLVPATQYELRTEADYIALLGEATAKGLPPAAIEEILRGYFNIRYASNPDMQRAFEVIAIADTLLTTNWQQITAMRAKGEVTAWEVALHQQALSLYDKMMQDPVFRGLETVFDKAEAMREFARVNLGGEQQPAQAPTLTPAQRARELAQETEEDGEDDTAMIDGVIELLRGITDMENRQRSAEQRLADFAREGVAVDRADFLQRVMA